MKTTSADYIQALQNASGASADTPFISARSISATLNFPPTNPQTSSDISIEFSGAKAGDIVAVGTLSNTSGASYSGFVGSIGMVTVRLSNWSSDTVNPPSQLFQITVIPQP